MNTPRLILLATLTTLAVACGFTPKTENGEVCYSDVNDMNEDWTYAICEWYVRCDAWQDTEPLTLEECAKFGFGTIQKEPCADGCLVHACMDVLRDGACYELLGTYPECLTFFLARDGVGECIFRACLPDDERCLELQAEDRARLNP